MTPHYPSNPVFISSWGQVFSWLKQLLLVVGPVYFSCLRWPCSSLACVVSFQLQTDPNLLLLLSSAIKVSVKLRPNTNWTMNGSDPSLVKIWVTLPGKKHERLRYLLNAEQVQNKQQKAVINTNYEHMTIYINQDNNYQEYFLLFLLCIFAYIYVCIYIVRQNESSNTFFSFNLLCNVRYIDFMQIFMYCINFTCYYLNWEIARGAKTLFKDCNHFW